MAEMPKLTIGMPDAGDTSTKVPPSGRITLSAEARRKLLDAICASAGSYVESDLEFTLGREYVDDPSDPDWQRIEDALLEILVPVRYVTGLPPRDTQANERLTPKPLHEHVPGAWNFEEPKP